MHTQQNISFRIWLTAVLANTMIGTAYLTGFQYVDALGFMFFGFCMSAIFSLPIYLLILWLIKECTSMGIAGSRILCIVLATSLTCTIGVYCGFQWLLGLTGSDTQGLFVIALLSAILGIVVQAHRLINISKADHE